MEVSESNFKKMLEEAFQLGMTQCGAEEHGASPLTSIQRYNAWNSLFWLAQGDHSLSSVQIEAAINHTLYPMSDKEIVRRVDDLILPVLIKD